MDAEASRISGFGLAAACFWEDAGEPATRIAFADAGVCLRKGWTSVGAQALLLLVESVEKVDTA